MLKHLHALEDALSDPAVQAQILKVAKEKFPEVHGLSLGFRVWGLYFRL